MKKKLLILAITLFIFTSCKKSETPAPVESDILFKNWYYQTRTRTDFTAGHPPITNTPTVFNGSDYISFSKHGYTGEYRRTNQSGDTLLRSLHYSYHAEINDKGENVGSLMIYYKKGPAFYEIKALSETTLRLVQRIYTDHGTTKVAEIETVYTSK